MIGKYSVEIYDGNWNELYYFSSAEFALDEFKGQILKMYKYHHCNAVAIVSQITGEILAYSNVNDGFAAEILFPENCIEIEIVCEKIALFLYSNDEIKDPRDVRIFAHELLMGFTRNVTLINDTIAKVGKYQSNPKALELIEQFKALIRKEWN